MTPYQILSWEACTRGPGAYRIPCPACGGGSDKEASLSLAVDNVGQISFLCFRASCGFRGGQKHLVIDSKKKEPRYFTAETVSLTEDRKCWFDRKFGFVPPDTLYAPNQDRYVYKVSDPMCRSRGYIARSFSGATPKVLTYNEKPEEPFIGWAYAECSGVTGFPSFPHGPGPLPIVIVEDWLSAEKVSSTNRANAVALNGTHLSLEMVREILEESIGGQVILALDRDAFAKALKYRKDYGELFKPSLQVWRLDVDLKYESAERIRKAIDDHAGFTGDFSRATDYQRSYL